MARKKSCECHNCKKKIYVENAVKLDLGCSIKDIAVPIMVDDIDEIHFNDGKLLYPTVWTQRKSAIKRFFKGLVQQTMLLFKK